tara:strand:+ start:263 stop:967 length:705 start_codon:yes stop_codon:yes gene_type:complete
MRTIFVLFTSFSLFSEELVDLFPLNEDGEIFYQEVIPKQGIKKDELFSSLKNHIQSPNFYFRTSNENGLSDVFTTKQSTDLSIGMRSIINARTTTNTISETKNEQLKISVTQFLPGNGFNPQHIFINYKLRLDIKDEAFRVSLYNFSYQLFSLNGREQKDFILNFGGNRDVNRCSATDQNDLVFLNSCTKLKKKYIKNRASAFLNTITTDINYLIQDLPKSIIEVDNKMFNDDW